MCHPKGQEAKYRSPSQTRTRAEYSRKYHPDESEGSDVATKTIDSSVTESEDVLLGKKNRNKRGKFPFAQVVNFMGKNGKRN